MPASSAQSEVAFTQLVKEHGLEHLGLRIGQAGYTTAALFAMACGVNYTQIKPKRFQRLVVCPLLSI